MSMAIALAIGREIPLGPFVLNHNFKGINDVVTFKKDKLNGTIKGPIWIVGI